MIAINNPGNIRLSRVKYIGELSPSVSPSFKQFASMPYGYRAMFVLLKSYAKRGYNTLAKIIGRYAPDTENDTASYIDYVSKMALHKNPDEKLDVNDRETAIKLVYAISEIENGVKPDLQEIEQGWELSRQEQARLSRFPEKTLLLLMAFGLSVILYKPFQNGTHT